jgi:putative heme-binding domain-containing protein
MNIRVFLLILTFCFSGAYAEHITLNDGDVVALVGNTFIERDAEYSYIETALTLANLDKDVIFRNYGWSGDSVKGESRGYFNADGYQDLLKGVAESKPTVILLAYGANAAWNGQAGLAQFKKDFNKLIDDLGKSTKARFILVSPIKQENLGDPYPDPTQHNKNLGLYSAVIGEIASARKFPFIDLYSKFNSNNDLSTNSIHLAPVGYRKVAQVIGEAFGLKSPISEGVVDLEGKQVTISGSDVTGVKTSTSGIEFTVTGKGFTFPGIADKGADSLKVKGLVAGNYTLLINGKKVAEASAKQWQSGVNYSGFQGETLRKAIVAKNELFFHAWRPQNTTYLFLFRKHEQGRNAKDIPAIYKHLQEREKKMRSLRQQSTLHYQLLSSTKAPKKLAPKTEKIDNTYVKAAEDVIKTFKLPEDLEISIFATEPMVVNPTNMNWDRQGRLWVCSAPTYPQIPAGELANDRILVLEDTDKDGKADKSTVFVEGLLIPTAVIPGNGGIYVANSTELVFFKDTDGDLKADEKTVILSGFGTEDTHHILHTPRWGQDGLLYINQSIYIHSHVETPYGVKRLMAGGIWQFNPHNGKLAILSYGLINSWGHEMDKWGQSFASDGASQYGVNFVFPGHAGVTAYGTRHIIKGMTPGQPKHCGLEIITGTHFPEKYRGLFLLNDFRGHRTNAFRVTDDGSAYSSKQEEDFLGTGSKGLDRLGKGGSFRPVDVKMGPDGAVYVADWSNIIIQHGEVDFRDKRRDQQHGRVWRITAKGRALIKQPQIAGASVKALLGNLKSTERWTVDMSKRELVERGPVAVLPELHSFVKALPKSAPADYLRLQALWIQQGMGLLDEALLKSLLKSKEGKIRAAAVRVLHYFHDQVVAVDDLLKVAITDSHPRVRLEAINALRVRKSALAAELAVLALDKEMDKTLEYALILTLRKLQPYWTGKTSFNGKVTHIAYAIKTTGDTSVLASLMATYRSGKIPAKSKLSVLSIIAAMGGSQEAFELLKLVSGNELSVVNKVLILQELNKAALGRKVRPTKFDGLKTLLAAKDVSLKSVAATLAGNWKVKAVLADLQRMSLSGAVPSRLAAVNALAKLRDIQTVVGIVENGSNAAVQMTALSALVRVDLKQAAKLAPVLLASIPENSDTSAVFDSFIRQKGGAKALENALKGQKLPSHVAAAGVRQCYSSGQQLISLTQALTTAGGIKPMKQVLNKEEMAALIKAVNERGNPHIGETVYRRQSILCLNCHAIGGIGSQIGPDLISIGASAPVDYLIESILQPTKKIKEGYHMTMVETKDGKVLSGTEVSADNKEVILRDALGKKAVVATSNIKKKTIVPMSLMPPGLTAQLNKDDFIHLISFLSKLGKSGDFNFSKAEYLRSFKYLKIVKQDWRNFIHNSPKFFKRYEQMKWQPSYAKVNGFIPLTGALKGTPQILRIDLEVKKGGTLALKLSSSFGIRVKLADYNELKFKKNVARFKLTKGKQSLFLLLDKGVVVDELRVELIDVSDEAAGNAVFIK